MKPTIGRIVLFTLPETWGIVNGAKTFPAIITAVHSPTLVNLRAFLDADGTIFNEWFTSVPLSDRPAEPMTWIWPPRDV